MALFQRISMLLSIIIFALATRQIIVNGITIDSFSDVCGRNAVPLYCNFSGRNNLQPLDTLGCGSSFLMSRNIDANDIGQAAGRLMECCAASQASALTHIFEISSASDPNENAREAYGYCASKSIRIEVKASKYHDILYQKLGQAYVHFRLQRYGDAKLDLQTA